MVGFLTDTKPVDANNVTFAGNSTDVNIMKPSDARRFAQALQGAIARAIADQGGTATLSGTNTYTATLAQAYTAYGTSAGQIINGTVLAIKPTAANTTAATINFNTIGAKAIRLQGDSALVGGEMLANGIYLLRYDTAYNSAAGAWVLLNVAGSAFAANSDALAGTSAALALTPANLAAERLLHVVSDNLGFSASVGSSALTVTMLGANGSAVSATNPVTIPFRNVTAATGTPSNLTVAAATSVVISSGSTMGFTSGVIGRLWIVGFNDGGTFRLGLVNVLSGTSILALRDGIYSSTAEGGSGGADSAQVIYTGTAVSSKAMTILGYLEATEATAGTWATAPSLIQIKGMNTPSPGDTVQLVVDQDSASASGTTVLPVDNTIPQNTEGIQFMSQAVTPLSGANVLEVHHVATYTNNAVGAFGSALFVDSVANAVKANVGYIASSSNDATMTVDYWVQAISTTLRTYKIRSGSVSAGTTIFNGFNAAQVFGGVAAGQLNIREIMA